MRSLFRVSMPRWRGGRYSLSKLFFNFYLLAMGSFVAIAFTADFVISTAQRGITDDYARRKRGQFSGAQRAAETVRWLTLASRTR
jgi:hypothetical protein